MKTMFRQIFSLAAIILLCKQNFANQLSVCSSGCSYNTLAAAVAAANAGDTINISGTITESDIVVSKNLSFFGGGMYTTIVQGSASRGSAPHRVFRITGGAIITFRDLTVQHGKEGTSDPTIYNSSGGAFCIDGNNTTLTLINVDVKNNDNGSTSGGAGGAIGLFGTSTNLNLYNCRIEGSVSPSSAGALYLSATNGVVTAKNTLFDNNTANGSGGAIFLGGTISSTYYNCAFTNNKATGGSGGAVYASSAFATFDNCTFSGNTASTQGGALRTGPGSITNCTFYQNTASTQGGAIFRSGTNTSPLSIVNCTIYGNAGSAGGGVYYNTTSSNVILVNSVLSNNTGGDFYASNSANLTVNQKNYVASSAFGTGSAAFAYTSGTLNINTPLTDNGGLTQTLSVGTGSVLINNGASTVSGVTVPQKDQRNYNRSSGVDIGAYEVAGSDGLSIAYSQLANSTSASNRSLSAVIADGSNGIPISGTLVPRIYFKKNAGSWYSAAGVLGSGTSASGTWNFTINHAIVGGVVNGDVISYFVTAQDNSSGSFAKCNLSGLVAADVTAVSVTPSANSYSVALTTLPVKLLHFEATKQGNKGVQLNWKVVEDGEVATYELLRNSGGGLKKIGMLPATGLTSYSFTDPDISSTVHYQLKIVETSGQSLYSKILSIRINSKTLVQLTPNLVNGSHALLSITSPTNTEAVYTIIDMAGRQVLRKTPTVKSGTNAITIPLTQLSTGQFYLQVVVGNAPPETIPFFKN